MTHETPHRPTPATRDSGRLVVLVSGTGSNLAALLAAHDDPAYGARVVAVVADRSGIRALDIAREAGIPTAVVSLKDFDDRAAWDAAVTETVSVFSPDLVVLAGFMKLFGATFLGRFGGRILNTHPALLPSFPGAHGVRDALAYGVKVTGCTVMVVDEGVDTGPILAQATVTVEPDDDEATLHERIKTVERELLVEWVGRIAREGLRIEGRRAIVG
ncbi:phosphoribosylglycinamide formyltransferase [Cellulomonas sp. Root137]|uniref:phosphoribosylglycinamide formyltransferase n=1 Tax=Cellulomonas sp. Root137 TaxID=1736459 RepID=UPI0006F51F12|nr:phosphoribosylglycinamide formyltransferase [Cellulomonas sp. Root137]KQY47347.1 phosphoribosylglycinamide formyltransferase [Cellulomonas sp. Root137]KRD44487.1 phosphoribosylglycinamide formyltransferase [Cellulomonas sp. Root930]